MKQTPGETITPPNPLAKAKSGDGPVAIDPAVLRQAEQVVEELQADYSTWAQTDIDALRDAVVAAQGDPKALAKSISEIYTHALDLKGQGGGFGYDLITSIGDLLTKFMEDREIVSKRDFQIICAHIDAMQAVVREDIKGDGGKVGIDIVEGLSELVLKSD
tara:strand:+ start:5204 stop:5686 length:483 start_codon:yes stop_codon:yes gene_type:complete